MDTGRRRLQAIRRPRVIAFPARLEIRQLIIECNAAVIIFNPDI
jgi:hypothetical protein